MNTDKIYAEQLTNEYAPKDTSKVVALRKLDNKAKLPPRFSPTPSASLPHWRQARDVPFHEGHRQRSDSHVRSRRHRGHYWTAGHGHQRSHLQKAAGAGQAEICLCDHGAGQRDQRTVSRGTGKEAPAKAAASPITGHYFNDLAFRGSISIYQGIAVNLFYVVFRVMAAIRYASVWFLSMAVNSKPRTPLIYST